MFLNWMKCQVDVWCKLNHVNLDHEHFNGKNGVYIIWHGGTDPKVVYVGQGNIRDRLKNHRSDRRIQQYKDLDLYVTWQQYLDRTVTVWRHTWLIIGARRRVNSIQTPVT